MDNLFHLSPCCNISKLVPRVPLKVWNEHEDNYVERVCFSDTLNGCLRALYADTDSVYNIYVPIHKIAVYDPTSKEVIDSKTTHEKWCLDEVPVVNIGKLVVTSFECTDYSISQELYIPETNYVWRYLNYTGYLLNIINSCNRSNSNSDNEFSFVKQNFKAGVLNERSQ